MAATMRQRPEMIDDDRTMTALVQERYGDTDVLSIRTVERPSAAADEVVVRVAAAGVDRGVWHLMTGLPYAVRLAGYGIRRPKTPSPGADVAGTVVAVGDGVTRFAVGDEVFGIGVGTFAEFAVAKEAKLAHRPPSLDAVDASVLAISGLTALQAVRDQARVRPGDHVLVLGASGGVGSYAVQIAKADGAEVTGVASAAKLDLVRSIGADHVIDHAAEEIPTDGRYDVILDTGGNRPVRTLRRALAPTGTLVIIGGEGGGRFLGGTDRQLRAMALSVFVRQRLTTFISSENADDIVTLAEMAEAGALTPALDRTFPLAEAPQAIEALLDGGVRGKLAVTVS